MTDPNDDNALIESGVTEIDFTNTVSVKVWDELGSSLGNDKDWDITVSNLSDAALITGFAMDEQSGAATINDGAGTIAIEVAALTDVTALIATITVSEGATVSPASLSELDYTDPVVFTVTSEDLTATKEYTVTVTVAA